MRCEEARELLPLSIDRELDARAEGALAEHLAACPGCDAERQALAGLVAGVRGAASYHRAPDGLAESIRAALPAARPASRRSRWHQAWRLANGAGLVAALAALLMVAVIRPLTPSDDERIAGALIESHARALVTGHVIDVASSDQHTVKPWFSARLDFSPPVRDFAEQGFPLEGGRLDYVDGQPAAVLVYHYRQHGIEVFVWPSQRARGSLPLRTLQGYHVVGWTAGGLALRVVSDAAPAELARLAELLRQ